MTRTLAILAVVFCCLVVPSAWSDAAVLYAANGAQGNPSNLLILNPATGGIVSTGGPIGFAVTGLAVNPLTGDLYGSVGNAAATAPGSLIKIDKTTGAGTLVGSFGIPSHTMADLTFSSDGTLYGWSEPDRDALHTIDLTTGHATRVGTASIGVNTFGSGLAANADTIFLAGRGGRGPLYKVDRTTGFAAEVAFLDWISGSGIGALAFGPDGVLFGMGLPPTVGPSAVLITIDPTSGHVTEIGPTVNFGDALAFDPPTFPASPAQGIPTLSELTFGLMAVLLAAIAFYQMRRRAQRASAA